MMFSAIYMYIPGIFKLCGHSVNTIASGFLTKAVLAPVLLFCVFVVHSRLELNIVVTVVTLCISGNFRKGSRCCGVCCFFHAHSRHFQIW